MVFERYKKEIEKILNEEVDVEQIMKEIVTEVLLIYEDYLSRGFSYDFSEEGLFRTELRKYNILGDWMENEFTGEREVSITGYIYPTYEKKVIKIVAEKLKEEFMKKELPKNKMEELSEILRELLHEIVEYIKTLTIKDAQKFIKK